MAIHATSTSCGSSGAGGNGKSSPRRVLDTYQCESCNQMNRCLVAPLGAAASLRWLSGLSSSVSTAMVTFDGSMDPLPYPLASSLGGVDDDSRYPCTTPTARSLPTSTTAVDRDHCCSRRR